MMEKGAMKVKRIAAWLAVAGLLALPGFAAAAEKGHGGMSGMSMEGGKTDHGAMMKMGDRIHLGPLGPWKAEARLVDMKAQMEKAKASGMKMEGAMMKTHHVSIHLIDPKSGHPIDVEKGSGTVTVAGPGVPEAKTPFMVMDGHFGADVNLPKPGKYTFRTEVGTDGKTGAATFTHTVK